MYYYVLKFPLSSLVTEGKFNIAVLKHEIDKMFIMSIKLNTKKKNLEFLRV